MGSDRILIQPIKFHKFKELCVDYYFVRANYMLSYSEEHTKFRDAAFTKLTVNLRPSTNTAAKCSNGHRSKVDKSHGRNHQYNGQKNRMTSQRIRASLLDHTLPAR